MATQCEKGAFYDETGMCRRGAGHRDPAAEQDDAARISGEISGGTLIVCGWCKRRLVTGDHSACFQRAMDGVQPN